ncbi:hypothetical protein BXZ70DRAFT_1061748 [Cristinia sonorae]|uniref:Uncharacterized protein n=1 Tax=Cristinia sonorae TaxID=1940300 RepID=A0A8K0UV64_9AGAR|nr:hypothetical protein BXZ70DRAFT_1061748 [Cristinia sonorae]
MPLPLLRRHSSLAVIIPSPVAGSVRLVSSNPTTTRTRTRTPRKRKADEMLAAEIMKPVTTVVTIPSSPSAIPPKRAALSLPTIAIPQYRPQIASSPMDQESICDGPPSPTATEIIDVEGEDFVRTAQKHGVKVRDFALEPSSSIIKATPVKEFWNPLTSLIRHDIHIRRPLQLASIHRITGKDLFRLLESGWVTSEEAEKNWTPADFMAMQKYRDQSGGPYPYFIVSHHHKPTAAYRAQLRNKSYPALKFAIPDSKIFVPTDVPGLWNGEAEAADTVDELESYGEGTRKDVHADKRRKVAVEDELNLRPYLHIPPQLVTSPRPLISSPSSTTTSAATSPDTSFGRTLLRTPGSAKGRALTRNRTLLPIP